MFGMEACPLKKRDINLLDFVVNRLFMKLLKTSDINILRTCQHTIRYDSGYLTCSKKLTGSQLSLPHGTNKKLDCETKNKMMSIIGPVQSRYREAVQ